MDVHRDTHRATHRTDLTNPSVPELHSRAVPRQPDSSAVEFGSLRALLIRSRLPDQVEGGWVQGQQPAFRDPVADESIETERGPVMLDAGNGRGAVGQDADVALIAGEGLARMHPEGAGSDIPAAGQVVQNLVNSEVVAGDGVAAGDVPGDVRGEQLTDSDVSSGSGVEAAESSMHAIEERLGGELVHLAEANPPGSNQIVPVRACRARLLVATATHSSAPNSNGRRPALRMSADRSDSPIPASAVVIRNVPNTESAGCQEVGISPRLSRPATWRHKHSTGLVGSPSGNSCNTRWSPGSRRRSSPTTSSANNAVVADRLGLDASTPLVYLERLRLAGDEPLALDRVWLPAALAAPLLGADFTHTSLYAELATRAGIRLDRGHEDVHAVVPTPAERAQLRCPPGTAAFSINRRSLAQGRPVEWRHTLVRGDRFALAADFAAGTGYRLTQAEGSAVRSG